MFADLIRHLSAASDARHLAPDQDRVALAALMVRVARTDGSYSRDEKARIDGLLVAHYGIGGDEAARVRARAELAEEAAQDTVQFTRTIKTAVPYEDRAAIVEGLWRVAATGGINAEERGLMRLVADLLGVSDVDSGLARQRALREGQ
jgi:uncharacterized tellurite resistance protein B-like protein